ncbi:conidial yellow pigment biosynthesis polyketide synthase [Patellaria atrata CBS 101060]|uniref:Conidial yellow pigment biosynthesis polyketide synthase n=1 Tax=Patellaria atrata CBS 101060 TaxID=1346257 RepID=A0A9P4VQK8_9PEZI|nr:conidial yellow pigment biosynthesis polyketide synthase [Patellaria atrata CBS 101060]
MLVRDAILFAGQGSPSLFTQGLSEDLHQFISSSVQAKTILSACFDAFVLEIQSLQDDEKLLLGEDIFSAFTTPLSLAIPSKSFSSNPIIQNTALYIQQMLEYLRYNSTQHEQNRTIDEVSGLCSGLIPAVMVAASPALLDGKLHGWAVEGFRLVFWIGIRVAQNSRTQGHNNPNDLPWSLVVSGLGLEEMNEVLKRYNQTEKPEFPICIASVLADRTLSLSGQGPSLHHFKVEYLPKSVTTRSGNVHGYYHGGNKVSRITRTKIIEDVRRRNIKFPCWEDLAMPIRSTLDGEYMLFDTIKTSLLEAILSAMFMKQVEWQMVSISLLQKAKNILSSDTSSAYRIIAIEPNAKSLLFNMKSTVHPRLTVLSSTSVSESIQIPSSRFNIQDYYQPDSQKGDGSRTTKSKYGNFMANPFDFDNGFFRISPREAKSMDPQQRNLLHTALDALEDAGYSPDATPTFQRDSFGVYVGVATGDYVDNTRDNIDVYYSTGTLRAFLSGRISYAFGFEGPSVVVDTACSSSMIALYQACRSLQAKDCTAALAGGVNVISSPDMHIGLSRAHFLNSSGQCKPFDASADGYCRAEGCGVFVLKRACDAIAEGDRIHGIIRGIEVNQCGTSKSITYPDSTTQAKLFQRLFNRHGVVPDSISVVEAHGTGTQAGDHAEINSIKSSFGWSRKPSNPLYVSSIKGNIGHAEAASGAAGLAKLVLMMREQQIPPQAAHETLNPRLGDLSTYNIVIPRELTAWRAQPQSPRRALLNNFGAAGSNAALILEEPIRPMKRRFPTVRSSYLLNISAKTVDAFQRLSQSYHDFAFASKDLFFGDLAYSASARRIEYDDIRLSIVADSVESALDKLKKVKTPDTFYGSKKKVVVFVFSGQGGIYQGMASELLETAPVFQKAVRTCDEILENLGYSKTEPCMLKNEHVLDDPILAEKTVTAQCACFVVEYALAKLWMSFGVNPDIAVGHSLGEYAMLAVAGAISLRDALFLVAKRAELMYDLCEPGSSGMMACHLSSTKLESVLSRNSELYPELSIACINSPEDCVLAGPKSSLSQFAYQNKPMGIKTKQLDVTYGFHSSALDPILEPFYELASTITTHAPEFTIASSTLGRILTQDDLQPPNFVKHAREKVDFVAALKTVEEFAAEKELLFLEIGPAPKTLPMVKATLNHKASNALPSLRPSEEPWVTINATLSSLYTHRQQIRWTEVFRGADLQFLGELPHYPLSPSTFIIPYQEPRSNNLSPERDEPRGTGKFFSPFSFLRGSCVSQPDGTRTFDTTVSSLADYIKSHAVGGVPICPASVYMELAAQANDLETQNFTGTFNVFKDIVFNKPLIYQEGSHMLVFTTNNLMTGTFNVTSGTGDLHCTGILGQARAEDIATMFLRQSSVINRQLKSVEFVESLSSRVIYDVIFPRVVQYSDPFLTIKQLRIAASGLEGFGHFKLPMLEQEIFNSPPPLVDTLLHAAGFIANLKVSAAEACICVRVEEAIVPRGSSFPTQELTLYCSLIDAVKGHLIADAYALDSTNNVRVAVRGMHFKILSLKGFQTQLALKGSDKARSPNLKDNNQYGSDAPRLAEISKQPQGEVFHALSNILSELCQLDGTVGQNTKLEYLGIDSLLFIEIAHKLEEEYPTLGDTTKMLESCTTVMDICKLIQSSIESGSKSGMVTPELDSMLTSAPSSRTPSEFRKPTISNTLDIGPRVEDLRIFIEKTCGFSITGVDKRCTLDSLGVDSLLSIEIEHGLREIFGIDINTNDNIISTISIEELEKLIIGNVSVSNSTHPIDEENDVDSSPNEPRCVTLLQGNEHSQTVLYLFHDGSGMSNIYSRISKLPCSVIGISSVDFDNMDNQIQSLEQLATKCIARAKLMDAEDFILGGWSFGGVLAYEVSRQLRAQGRSPRGVMLIDSPSPLKHDPLPDTIIEQISSKFAARSPKTQRLRSCVEAQFKRNARLLGKYTPNASSARFECVMLQCVELVDTLVLYGVEYPFVSDREFRMQDVADWEQLIKKPIPVYPIKGNHFSLFAPDNVSGDYK